MTKEEIMEQAMRALDTEDEALGKKTLGDILLFILDGVERVVEAVETIAENSRG